MKPELEKLIDYAVIDGELSESEKSILFEKAKLHGVNHHEFEMILQAKLYKRKEELNTKERNRDSEKVGLIKKCPSCGGIINPLKVKCELCGFELNIATKNQTLIDFLNKLVELGTTNDSNISSKTDLIEHFPVPNNKEDLFEFLSICIPQIEQDERGFNNFEKKILKAWLIKSKQLLIKAKGLFKNDGEFIESINKLEEKVDLKLNKLKSKANIRKRAIVSLVIICGFGLLFIILNTNKERDKKNSLNTLTSYLSNAETDPSILQKCVTIARNLIEDYPDEIEIIEVYGDILRKNGQISDAADQYSKAIGIDNKNQPIWNKLLYCLLKTKSHDELLSKSMKAIELFPEIAIFYYYNGKALIHKNRHDLAVKTLQKGSTLLDKDASLNVEFYWLLAESYQELKDNESSDLYYEKALIIDPKNPNILNSYSYRLSVRKVNLERAAKMAKLSIEIDPGKPENQDTYGWILYMQGEYNESKKWIEMALNSGGYEIGTILEHYGDVLYRLNDSIGALEYWKKAKVAGNTTEFIDKKIENKTLYE